MDRKKIDIPVKIEKTIDIALIGFSSKGSQNKTLRINNESLGLFAIIFINTTINIGNELSNVE
tara:strand:+ start:590 stop:778 length:189 start_codon:yes stop_codon:yes gene_type:complete